MQVEKITKDHHVMDDDERQAVTTIGRSVGQTIMAIHKGGSGIPMVSYGFLIVAFPFSPSWKP